MDNDLAYIIRLSSELLIFLGVVLMARSPFFKVYESIKALYSVKKNRKHFEPINKFVLWVGKRMESNMKKRYENLKISVRNLKNKIFGDGA